MIDHPILITGIPRSGVSLTAGVFYNCGLFGGYMKDISLSRWRTIFENGEIRKMICDPLLLSFHADPLGQHPLPAFEDVIQKASSKFCKELQDKVLLKIITQGYDKGHWFYKDSRLCLLWQIWAGAFPHAIWVLVRREKEEIVQSCMKTAYMKAFQTPGDWSRWVDEYESRFEAMKRTGLKIYEVYPGKIIRGDYTEVKDIADSLGLSWNEAKVRNFIDFKLCSGNNTAV